MTAPGLGGAVAPPAIAAINSVTTDPVLRQAMALGSWMEGGWGPTYGVGDHGHSFGPFQIYLVAHPDVTAAQASDPNFAARYMLPAYTNALNTVRAQQQVSTGDANSLAQVAFHAERPKVMYPSSRVAAAFQAVQQVYSGAAGQTDPTAPAQAQLTSSNPVSDALAGVGRFFTALLWLVDPMHWVRIILGVLGMVFLGAGLVMFVGAV